MMKTSLAWTPLIFAAYLVGCHQEAETPSMHATSVALQTEQESEPIGWQLTGVGSCTASGCHGNAKPNEIVGSEYNIWISADPHSRAFSVLYDERSLKMVQILDGDNFNPALPPYQDKRCLSCHSTTFAPSVEAAGDVFSDGVGCEACHGPAEGWLAEHYRPDFEANSRERLGMWDTKDLYSRAQICTSCHVGSPGREVNHDLIAAGHPRLQFEMGAYLQALPKHWDERMDRARSTGNFEFLAWALGQTATSRAALKQLANRASSGALWPELSEWSCGACHHDLLDTASRQDALAAAGGLSAQTIRWDDWNHHLVREHASLIASAIGKDGAAGNLQKEMAELARIAGSIHADREQVVTAARTVGNELDAWAELLRNSPVSLPMIDGLMRSLVQTYERGVADTTEAMQVYDALATLQQTRLDKLAFEKMAPRPIDQAVTARLAEMFEALTKEDPTPIAEIIRVQNVTSHLAELAELLKQRESGK